jgi:spore coat protein U-like protein
VIGGRLAAAACLMAVAGAVDVRAQFAQAGFSIGATVGRSCHLDGSPLAFGNYDPIASNANAPLDASTMIVVTCTKGTPAAIAMNAGGNASGSQRFLASGPARLGYELYQDPARQLRWGDTPSEMLMLGASSGDPRSVYVYGRVPANQDVQVGTYSDSVVATVYF